MPLKNDFDKLDRLGAGGSLFDTSSLTVFAPADVGNNTTGPAITTGGGGSNFLGNLGTPAFNGGNQFTTIGGGTIFNPGFSLRPEELRIPDLQGPIKFVDPPKVDLSGRPKPPRPKDLIPVPTDDIIEKPTPIPDEAIRVIRGCLNPTADNYNSRATVHDESLCVYPTPSYTYDDLSRPVKINVSVDKGANAKILVDNVENVDTPSTLEFTEKELLTPKKITATRGNSYSTETFRVYTKKQTLEMPVIQLADRPKSGLNGIDTSGAVKLDKKAKAYPFTSGGTTQIPEPISKAERERPLTGNFLVYTYYEVHLDKLVDGNFVPQSISNLSDISLVSLKNKITNLNLSFSFSKIIIIEGNPSPVVRIFGDVPDDKTIGYRIEVDTPAGKREIRSSFVKDGVLLRELLDIRAGESNPRITLFSNIRSINDWKYEYTFENAKNSVPLISNEEEFTFNIDGGINDLKIVVYKKEVFVDPSAPLLNVNTQNLVLNYSQLIGEKSAVPSGKGDIKFDNAIISYSSADASTVFYSLGDTFRELSPSGTIKLTAGDFKRGIGNYVLYLQPYNDVYGSGETTKINITVKNQVWLPGPDITDIDYPSYISGKDFVEYNVNFDVSWQSINTNYIHIYAGKVDPTKFLGKFAPSGKATFNVEKVLKKAGETIDFNRNLSIFNLLFVPYNQEGDELTDGKIETVRITFDKGDLKLKRGTVVNDIKSSFRQNLNRDGFKEYISEFLTHYLHLGQGKNLLVGAFGVDKDTLSEKKINPNTNELQIVKEERSLVLKLYEPLPRSVNTNDKVWISKIQSIPIIDKITIVEDSTKDCVRLTPNFDLDFGDDIGYQIYDDLVASGSVSSTSVVNQFVSSSNFSLENLDLNFITGSDYYWENFVKYSSAEERIENFIYKVKLIEAYESKISNNNSETGSASPAIINENNRIQGKINSIKKEFDAFEKFLYSESSSLSYPGAGQNELSASNDSSVISWYNGIVDSAANYDYNNPNLLRNNLPEHILKDSNNGEFVLFLDMVGQHFDVVYTHAKGFAQSRKLEHQLDSGIKDSLISHMLESLGWDTSSGLKSQVLWEYAFGVSKDGTQVSSMSGKEKQNEVWRRILNNLPYLYKHKGTKRAIHAALSCYGVPASLLTIMEFGGPQDPTSSGVTKFSFEDRTAAINISGSSAITIPWKEYNGDHPNAIEIRVQTSERQDHRLIEGDFWHLDILKDTGSLAKVQLTVGDQSASTEPIPFFNDEYKSIFINRISGSANYSFDLYVKEGFQERIRNEASVTLPSASLSWENGSLISIGGSTFMGSVDEFRLWKDPLAESLLDNHTLLPDAINGNHISSSTEDLLFRLDFEYPINVAVGTSTVPSGSIKNVSLIRDYALFATASNFENITSYPYQYTPYDRTVTAEVPSSGFNVGNKIRFEDQTLISNLNYKTRATRKMYDQAPIDSNRLGLFFSPIKEINMDILRSIGSFNIDDYIGDPSDEYSYEYKNLKDLRNYYFDRYTLNFQEYIQLVRYIDKSLFDVLAGLVPERAKLSRGLLIEPHILERSKTKWNKPSGEKNSYQVSIDTQDDINVVSTNHIIDVQISASNDVSFVSETPYYDTTIETQLVPELVGSRNDFSSSIDTTQITSLEGTITRNSGSTMGGFEINIDATFNPTFVSQHTIAQNYQSIGVEPDSITVAGFGLYGENGNVIRTRIDKNNNYIKDRVKVYLLTEQYTEFVPTYSSSLDGSRLSVPRLEEVTKTRKRINILPFTGSNGLENELKFTGSEDYVSHEPLDGYFPTHYRNVGDLTTGLQNSYYNGSKQTSATTLDGGSPVETFTTNPNTLRVNDSGRGSGEPILEVD